MPVSIKKSSLRDGRSPVDTAATKSSRIKFLRSSSLKRDAKRKLFCNKIYLRNRNLVSCKRCGTLLKPSNSTKKVCICKRSKNPLKVNAKVVEKTKCVQKSNDRDPKLHISPVVAISWNCQMKADAAMKLRKGHKTGERSSKTRVVKEESEDDIEDSSSSEYEDSEETEEEEDDDDVFEPKKTYPLRKKTGSRKNKVTPKRRVLSSSSSSSTSGSCTESLPDIDCPVDSRFKVNDVKKTNLFGTSPINGFGSSESKRNQTSSSSLRELREMGSNQGKSSRRSSDDKTTTKLTARSLRSTDSPIHSNNEPSHPKSTSEGNRRSSTPSPQKLVKARVNSSYKSPAQDASSRLDKSIKAGTSSVFSETEKSYSLRCLEKKDIPRAGSSGTSSRSEIHELKTPIQSNSKALLDRPVASRGRGRPRKIPIKRDETVGTSAESSTPLTRSQRRATLPPQNADHNFQPSVPDNNLKSSDGQSEACDNNTNDVSSEDAGMSDQSTAEQNTSSALRNYLTSSASLKQSRDAIALRARQSKIMAKSRVLQSNRNHSAALRVLREMRKEERQKHQQDQNKKPTSFPVLKSPEQPCQPGINRSINTQMSNNNNSRSIITEIDEKNHLSKIYEKPTKNVASVSTSSSGVSIIKKSYPKASCDLCNMTFTRRFSLTKHLLTIQHQKMIQKMANSASQGMQNLSSEVPIVKRERKPYTGGKSLRALPPFTARRSAFPMIKPQEKILIVEGNGHQSECIVFGDSTVNIPSEERDVAEPEEPPEPVMEEWKSGKTLGRNDFKCEVCEEKFTDKIEFGEHIWNHREDASLTCVVCGEHFDDSDDYNQHIDNAHLENTKFSCQYCPSKFTREDYLKKHMTSHRNQNERYVCSVCDKRFSVKTLLMRHIDAKHFALGRPRVELACDDDSDDYSRDLKIPEYITCDSYYENEDPNSYDDGDTDPDEYKDQMPNIDLEEVGSLVIPRSRHLDNVSENDPIPIITPEDYSREHPVESFSEFNSSSKNISQTNPEDFYSSSSPVFKSEANSEGGEYIRMGCGYKSARFRAENDTENNPLACLDCGKIFQNRKSLFKHVDYFTQAEQYSCNVCKMKFKFSHHLKRHMQRHISTSQTNLMKKSQIMSGFGSRKPSQFLKHRKLIPRKLPKLLPILPNNHEGVSRNEHSVPNLGTPCYPSSSKKLPPPLPEPKINLTLQQPQQIVATATSKTETNNPHSSMLKKSIPISSSPTQAQSCRPLHTCDLCSKTFTEKQTLTVHMWFHQNENLFSCPDCDAKCERKSDLDLHYKCHETQQPFFLCYVCFKPFRWKKDMIRHVRKKHPAERTYRCLYCPERFSKNDELTFHIAKSHPEHRSFLCIYCGRRYAQRRYLLVHYQTQHGIDPEIQQQDAPLDGNNSGSNNITMDNYDQEPDQIDMEIDIESFLETNHQM